METCTELTMGGQRLINPRRLEFGRKSRSLMGIHHVFVTSGDTVIEIREENKYIVHINHQFSYNFRLYSRSNGYRFGGGFPLPFR